MGKSKNNKYYNYHLDRDYDDGEYDNRSNRNRSKEKRFDRALRTKNIQDLVDIEDDGIDPDEYEFMKELEEEQDADLRIPR